MIHRKSEDKVLANLDKDLILLLIGARQVGKTTILNDVAAKLKAQGKSVYSFTLEDPQLLKALNGHPENIFNSIPKDYSRKYLLLDEIQYLDDPSNFLKYIYDTSHPQIQLIVTGSSAFYIDEKFKDSLAGRKRIIEIHSFSFSEFLLAKKEVALASKIDRDPFFETPKKKSFLAPEQRRLRQLWSEYFVFGGYPRVVLAEGQEEKIALLKELYQSFLKKDIHEANLKNEALLYGLLAILAAQAGNLVNTAELGNALGTSRDTITHCLHVLQKSFIIKLCSPFSRNIRKELTKMPKVFFFDNGYRHAILNNFEPLTHRVDSGMSLENHLFSEWIKGDISDIKFWRTQDKNEIDFIVNENNAFEVKMNPKTFHASRYSHFQRQYPKIPLRLVTHFDEHELDVLDFSS